MEISTNQYKRCDLVTISGRIDSFTAPKLAESLSEVTQTGRFNLVIDLSKVEYISSAGLRVLIDVQKTCKQFNRGEVILISAPKRIYETLELAGFVPLFRFFDDVTTGVSQF